MGNGSEDSNATLDGSEELIKGSGNTETESEDWLIECSDDENYNPTGLDGGVWEPEPADIKTLYERLAKGETLELEWKCPGRRSPSPEQLVEEATTATEPEEKKEEERILPKGFDFDEEMDTPGPKTSLTPRRTPGSSKTPRSVRKRVARMDKIMNDILRHKKLEAAVRKAAGPGQRKLQMTPTGQRKLLMAGAQRKLPLSPGAVRKSPGTPTGTGEIKQEPTTPGDNKPLPTSTEAKFRPTPTTSNTDVPPRTGEDESAPSGTDIDTKFGILSMEQNTASHQNVP